MELNSAPNVEQPDDLYQALIDAHTGLTEQQSAALNARLILLLANHIGDLAVVRQAIDTARESLDKQR